MLLVVGATGELGTAICRRLRDKGLPVRGLVRATSDSHKVNYLKSLGVHVVEGNLKTRSTLDAACEGVDSVITTASITLSRQPDDTIQNVDQAGQLNLVDAAKAAGASRFIYISYSQNIDTNSPLTRAKRAVEQALIHSGMTYTILRPGFFMEVWFTPIVGFDYLSGRVTIYGSGEQQLSWISRGDVAAFTIAAVSNPAACNTILELGGPESLTPLEVVCIFEKATGRAFEVQHVSEAELRTQKEQANDSVLQSFNALMLDYAKGDLIDMTATSKRFPMRLMSVEEYANTIVVLSR